MRALARAEEPRTVESERDPVALIDGARNLLTGLRDLFVEDTDWYQDRHLRVTVYEQAQFAQQIIARLRLVLTVQPPFDSEEDWRLVEQGVRNLDRRQKFLGGIEE